MNKQIVLLMSLVTLFSNCQPQLDDSTVGAESSSSDSADSHVEEIHTGNISFLTIENGSSQSDLSDVADDVLVVLFNYSEDNSNYGYRIGETVNSFLKSLEENTDVTEDFHEMLREIEDLEISEEDEPLQSHGRFLKLATIGSQKNFKVLESVNSGEGYTTVTATLRVSTERFEFWVDDRNADSISDTELQDLADGFAVNELNQLFGNESDVDQNGKFSVLFSQAVNELGSASGGFVTGYFYALDLYDSENYPVSNEMEIFYTVVPDPQGEFGMAFSKEFSMNNIFPTVLPHEYQHMISYNQHRFINNGFSEKSWLNEALSHLAEDINSIDANGFMAETSIENPSRVKSYLDNVQNICFSCGSSLSQRGGSYLFIRYLYEQAELGNLEGLENGADLIASLLNTDLTGLDNLEFSVFSNSESQESMKSIFGRFALTVYLSNTGASVDSRLNFTGINLRTTQNDNRNTVLDGPAIQNIESLNFTDSLQGVAMTYLSISSSALQEQGGRLDLSFDENGGFGGYLISR